MSNVVMFGLNFPGTHQLSAGRGAAKPPRFEGMLRRKFAVKLWVMRERYAHRKTHVEMSDAVFRAGFGKHAGSKASVSCVELQEQNKMRNNLLISLEYHPFCAGWEHSRQVGIAIYEFLQIAISLAVFQGLIVEQVVCK